MYVKFIGFALLVLWANSIVFGHKLPSEVDKIALPNKAALELGFRGYQQLKESGKLQGKNNTLTIIDYSLSANQKRLWVIDMSDTTVIYHSLVSHGKNSGNEYARSFSNVEQSYQTSLGFFLTGKTYEGKHGYSLRLTGLEPGINDNARKRAIVVHGASYVSQSFIQRVGRLGRSHGCPALPVGKTEDIINCIKGGGCIFAYYPDRNYLNTSSILN